MAAERRRLRIEVGGRVQGVGFRPAVYRYARERSLGGWVTNTPEGVVIEVEGAPADVAAFLRALEESPPPAASVVRMSSRELPAEGASEFRILASRAGVEVRTEVSPDLAVCPDCLRELADPKDRRHGYPFLNCTNCGPRFTIVRGIPYDRAQTTMEPFRMCPRCRAEYEDPADRRFHAQPTACPECGPRVWLAGPDGAELAGPDEAVARAAALLCEGRILAVKGLGGFHLACDASNEEAVRTLRGRKYREDKPFALMARDLEEIRRYCAVDAEEAASLESVRRPIVLLRRAPPPSPPPLGEGVAPGQGWLGFMLPYTPLQQLLFDAGAPAPLVMTSGNLSEEPIACQNEEALARLAGIADAFLLNDRDIHIRCDDSVCRVWGGAERVLRRSRGYAPAPIRLSAPLPRPILACGAELKNTFSVAKGGDCFLSQHIGDLGNLETLESFERGIEHFERVFQVSPGLIACDRHPDYLSTKYARERAAAQGLRLVSVQHHHAHIAACMADNRLSEKVIGVAYDGTGYGDDGTVWGGEILVADYRGFERAAHLKTVPMPGGDQAIREPWRMAASHLVSAFGPGCLDRDSGFTRRLDRGKWEILQKAAESGLQSPRTSSMGRLFDAVAALVGVRDAIRYEGQAAIELEMLAHAAGGTVPEPYPFATGGGDWPWVMDPAPVLQAVIADLAAGTPAGTVAARFHRTAAAWTVSVCSAVRSERGLQRVALSGGVFQNTLLLEWTCRSLQNAGFSVLTHRQVPTNDGGICLGQTMIASESLTGR